MMKYTDMECDNMKKYQVHIEKVYSADIEILAESETEAEESAFYKCERGEIDLSDSGVPGDIEITVKERSAS